MFRKQQQQQQPLKPMFYPTTDFFRGNSMTLLREYDWLSDYQKMKALQAEIQELKQNRLETKALPLKKSDLLKLAKGFFDEYRAERQKSIQRVFGDVRDGQVNPLSQLTESGSMRHPQMGTVSFLGGITWAEIEAAIKALPRDGGSLSLSDREKSLSLLDSRIAKLQSELDEIFPKSSQFRRMGLSGDARDKLVAHWCKLQKRIDAPCSPTGYDLTLSSAAEQIAHAELKISDFINENAEFRPHDPNE